MNRIISIITCASALMIGAASCEKEESGQAVPYSAILTIREQPDHTTFFSMDEENAFLPINKDYQRFPFKDSRERRAIVYFTIPEDANAATKSGSASDYKYVKNIMIAMVDTIYIAPTRPSEASVAENAKKYGNSFISLLENGSSEAFSTSDGYLNMAYRMYYGNPAKHSFTLVTGENPDNPYEVHVRHNDGGDNSTIYYCDGIMNFCLKNLPDTNGEEVDLTIKWDGYFGESNTRRVKYKTRTNW